YAMANGNLASRAIVTNALGTAGTVDNVIVGDTLVDGNMYINGTLSYSSNTSAETVVTGSNTVGEMTIANTGGASVDANGALSTSGATGATASLTLTNSQNNTHGMVVTESQTTISGGTTSSSLTLDDRGATFSDSSTGAPVQVHGVDDGTADFDAVNVRQFGGAIAATAAMAQIPELDSNATGNLGIGVASFMGYQGLAVATQVRVNERTVIRGGVSSNLEGKARPIIGVGAAFSW
ncbi:MAG: YadA-like family protein, partial [Litorivicinus sp.]